MSQIAGWFAGNPGEESDAKVKIISWDDIEPLRPAPGAAAQPLFTNNMSLNWGRLEANMDFAPMHWHPEEQVTLVLEGALEIETPDETWLVRAGQVVVCPPNTPHAARTRDEGAVVVDIFSPPRAGIPRPE